MSPATTAWLANVRAEAEVPGAFMIAIQSGKGRVVIFPDEVVGKSDEELLAFVRERTSNPDR